jgi:hypothetical protein
LRVAKKDFSREILYLSEDINDEKELVLRAAGYRQGKEGGSGSGGGMRKWVRILTSGILGARRSGRPDWHY